MLRIEGETQEYKLSNEIAARAALLDFYGSRAVSCASLFIASVFGLVTMVPVIQTIVNAHDFRIGFEPELRFNDTVLVISAIAYLGFAYVAFYTYRKSTIYADICDALVTRGPQSLESSGIPASDRVIFKSELSEQDLQALKDLLKDGRKHKMGIPVKVKEGKYQNVNMYVYVRILLARLRRPLLRRVGKYFTYVFPLSAFALAILAYHSILGSYIPVWLFDNIVYLRTLVFVLLVLLVVFSKKSQQDRLAEEAL